MKITITGASGFVGQNLQEYLKAAWFECVRYIPNQRFYIETDAIILAGKAHDLKGFESIRLLQSNFELTNSYLMLS
jgi:nucleoside-diphosphate-sugar epimerase